MTANYLWALEASRRHREVEPPCASSTTSYVFEVSHRREQDRDPCSGGEAFQRHGDRRSHDDGSRPDEALQARCTVKQPNWKKAIVTVHEDQSIDLFEGI
jgi:hypothetical protein